MEVHFAPSFERILKKLDAPIKEEVKETVSKVIDFYLSSHKTHGLGVKRLQGDIWEARAGIRIRVLYELTKNRVSFVLAGSHDDVKNFLKRL